MKVDLRKMFEPVLSNKDWATFQQRYKALAWLADEKHQDAEPPDFVEQAIAETIGRMRPVFLVGHGFELRPVRRDGRAVEYRLVKQDVFDDVETFWQMAFASLLVPDLVRISGFCSSCGAALPPAKGGRPSKAVLCNRCNVRTWRENNRAQNRSNQRTLMQKRRKKRK